MIPKRNIKIKKSDILVDLLILYIIVLPKNRGFLKRTVILKLRKY
jgi:hypothetical protein